VSFASLEEAERYLDGFVNLERQATFDYARLGLGRIRALLAAIGDPHVGLPAIHIAGSKGKGSTAFACEALLRAAGLRVGAYTKPHLETWRERFRLDGELVGEAPLILALARMRPALERLRRDPELRPSFFDVATALALLIFREANVDVAVIEVGIGGRLDSTNVVDSKVSVLTSVQLEHTDKLGPTLEAIAGEKAGIARKGVPFLHAPLEPEAWGALAAKAVDADAPLEEVRARAVSAGDAGIDVEIPGGRRVFAALRGAHQAPNVGLAVAAVESFLGRELASGELAALSRLQVPARIERFGDVVLDCSHTPDSVRALRETLAALEPGRRWVLVASLARDKDAAGIFAEIGDAARACVLTRGEPVRAADPEELAPLAWASGIETVETADVPRDALARARALARPGELVVIAGSLYLAGALRSELTATLR
jgi:dihydrofolate synthase/folylpolyglutamate synthase